jgi:hypothetical protein
VHTKSHSFSLSPSRLCLFINCLLHHTNFPRALASETNQTLLAVGNIIVDDAKAASLAESDVVVASSSSNAATEKMMKKDVPVMTDYWKKSSVTEVDQSAYHSVDWLPGGVESFMPDLESLMVDNTTIVCFESHLATGLGFLPASFTFLS